MAEDPARRAADLLLPRPRGLELPGPRIPLPLALTLDAPTAGLEAATARELATVLAERVIGRRSAAKDEAAVDAV
ncbi:MAG: hypothetical protein DWQ36_25290, partial [Acidobacteria bacterium]